MGVQLVESRDLFVENGFVYMKTIYGRKKLALFLTIFVICNGVYCQKILSGKVVDLQTAEPIPFVHIFDEYKGFGTTTNTKGEFNMIIPDSLQELDFIFSHVGYVHCHFHHICPGRGDD